MMSGMMMRDRGGGIGGMTNMMEMMHTGKIWFIWMFHCHILEHQESGMMGMIRVA
jgi:Multicopper oxidase